MIRLNIRFVLKFVLYSFLFLLLFSCSTKMTVEHKPEKRKTIKVYTFDRIKYELIKALTNDELDIAKKLLDRLFIKYENLNNSQKCDYHQLKGCHFFLLQKFVKAEEEFTKCLAIDPNYLQTLFSRANMRKFSERDINASFLDYQKILAILNYYEEIETIDENYLITIYAIYPFFSQIRSSPHLKFKQIILNNKVISYDANFGSKTMTPNELRSRCYTEMEKILFTLKNYLKAIEFYKGILESEPHRFEYHRKIADCYFDLDQYEDAIEAYNKFTLNNEKDVELIYRMAVSYFYLDRYETCIEEFTNFFKKMKDDDIYKIEAPELLLMDNNEKTRYNIALIDNLKQRASALMFRARSYGKLKNYQKGIDDLNEVLKIDNEYASAYYYLGYFNNYLGNKRFALVNFKKALELKPDFTQLYYSIAIILDTDKKYKTAIEYYNLFLRNDANISSQKYVYALKRVNILRNQ